MIERPSQISCMPVSAVIHVMVISLFFLIHLKKHKKKVLIVYFCPKYLPQDGKKQGFSLSPYCPSNVEY